MPIPPRKDFTQEEIDSFYGIDELNNPVYMTEHRPEKRMEISPGRIITSPEKRMEICAQCPMMNLKKFLNIDFSVCGKYLSPVKGKSCGCILEVKTKLKSQRCPQKKW